MNEKLKVYDTKMQKTMDSLDSEMGTIRSGTENDSDSAMGEEHAQSYRESNHGF